MNSTAQDIRRLAGDKRRIVFVSGNFNIVHPGHLRLLKFASECGDFLAVGVNDNNSRGVILSAEMRLESVNSISFVDYAFILKESTKDWIERLKPDVVVKGKEFEDRDNAERNIVESYGGKLLFGAGETRFSSLELITHEADELTRSVIQRPSDFPQRHGFKLDSLHVHLRKFSQMHVAVIGDLIVDEYIACEPLGMSQEDPSIVVSPIASDKFIGGAGIVAAHARGLGAQVQFFSIAGADETRDYALGALHKYGVDTHIFVDESRPTTLKMRYRASGKTLLRVSHLRQHGISKALSDHLLAELLEKLQEIDLLIFSDFNYGCLPQDLVDAICVHCKRLGIPMVADSQSSSQVGDIARFKDMLLITPTEREARLALRDFNSGMVVLAEQLHQRAAAQNVVITLGAEGLLGHKLEMGVDGEWVTDRLPAFNTVPKDTAGAGDSFLTCASMALVAGSSLWQSMYLGSLAAACQVGRVGNTPLSPAEIEAQLDD
ncbi:MAG: PfkB family carbohydrate kinase [Candidatus Protistobacter heckmanni]|nr:PfkB family carbohydrate kinase [Candidatus Protistobacter heckmanni]